MCHVMHCELRYMAANERCKSAEETIKRETENMEQLSKTVEEKFNEVRERERYVSTQLSCDIHVHIQ